jgi:hypothetical protein
MADGVVLNAGAGGVTAVTDDCGVPGHAQVIKLAISTDGSATLIPADAGNGLDVDVTRSALPTGASTSAKQPALGTAGTASTDVISVQGIAAMTPLLTTPSLPSGASTSAKQDSEIAALGATTDAEAAADGSIIAILKRLRTLLGGTLAISAASLPLPTGAATAAKQPALGTAGTSSADVLTVQGRASMTPLLVDPSGVTSPVSLATNTPVGNVTHGNADSGAPIKIGYRADTTFQAAEADGDRVDALADVYGVPYVRPDHPNKWNYHEDSSSALTDASVQAAPGAGLSVYLTDIIISLGAATALNLFMEEGATKIIGPLYLEAVNGRTIHLRFQTPKKCTANTAVTVTTSAALAHGLEILGFIAP